MTLDLNFKDLAFLERIAKSCPTSYELLTTSMKKGRDFEYSGKEVWLPPEYVIKRIDALKVAYTKAKEIMPDKIKFGENVILISHEL